jgi:hypothetical protein
MQVGQGVVTAIREEIEAAEQRGQASVAEVGTLRLELAQTKAKHLALHGTSHLLLLG